MINEFTAEAETVEEALEIALKELGASIDEIDYTVTEEPGKKRFGFGASKHAKVTATRKSQLNLTGSILEDEVGTGTTAEESIFAEDSISSQEKCHTSFGRDQVDYSSLTDEEIDKIADVAITVITKLADLSGATGYEIEEFEGEEGEIILDLVGGDLSFLIGRHGRTLDALQTAASAIVTKQCGIRYPISIDIEGYRHRRKQKVREIAQRAAERALRHGRPVEMRPMSPQERRLVHVAIRDIKGVTSTSEGNGDSRHVVVLVEKN